MIGYDLTSTVIAFHYALLAMKFKEPRVDTNHPSLLIVDEPEQQRMPEETFLKIMALLKNLANPTRIRFRSSLLQLLSPMTWRNMSSSFRLRIWVISMVRDIHARMKRKVKSCRRCLRRNKIFLLFLKIGNLIQLFPP